MQCHFRGISQGMGRWRRVPRIITTEGDVAEKVCRAMRETLNSRLNQYWDFPRGLRTLNFDTTQATAPPWPQKAFLSSTTVIDLVFSSGRFT
jgi:hypothetical protein